jgi:hypothetical protein
MRTPYPAEVGDDDWALVATVASGCLQRRVDAAARLTMAHPLQHQMYRSQRTGVARSLTAHGKERPT